MGLACCLLADIANVRAYCLQLAKKTIQYLECCFAVEGLEAFTTA